MIVAGPVEKYAALSEQPPRPHRPAFRLWRTRGVRVRCGTTAVDMEEKEMNLLIAFLVGCIWMQIVNCLEGRVDGEVER